MLKQLSIQNYALIQNLELSFGNELNIITGETGAGKSILLGSLGLVLGNRADYTVLQDKERKCIVEALFDLSNYSFQDFFAKNDLDYEDETLIRREVSPQGKSRAFINDTPVKLELLKSLGFLLVDIHSQHQSLQLGDLAFQLEVIDAIAGNAGILKKYQLKFSEYRSLKKNLFELEEKASSAMAEFDFLDFQYKELEELAPVEGEQEQLESEQKTFSNLEEIKTGITELCSALSEQEGSALNILSGLKNKFESLGRQFEKIKELNDRYKSVFLELDDISSELQHENELLVYDPDRAEQIEARLSAIYHLEQKHRVNSIEELISIMHGLDQKLNEIGSFEEEISKLKKAIAGSEVELKQYADQISDARKKAFPEFRKKTENILEMLGMPNSRIDWEHGTYEDFQKSGLDKVEILFTANKGSELQAINKVASGGELSRLMLAIKSILADYRHMPSIIFDEIDSGVSGDIANKMGIILKEMAKHRQVVSITHLPQLAAKGQHHYFVYKQIENNKTVSNIKKLNDSERVDQLAIMLSGSNTSKAALENAKELLNEE